MDTDQKTSLPHQPDPAIAALITEALDGTDYQRISVPLRSGDHAWVYAFAG